MPIPKYDDARAHWESERGTYGKKRNGAISQFLRVIKRRAHIQEYFEIMMNPHRLTVAVYGVRWDKTGEHERRARVMAYDCGCVLPFGYPLYRKFKPCSRHEKSVGGLVDGSGTDDEDEGVL